MKTNKEPDTLTRTPADVSPGEIIIGIIADINADGKAMVDFSENISGHPLVALSTMPIHRQHIKRQVALLFANGNLDTPVIMGLIHNPLDALLENQTDAADAVTTVNVASEALEQVEQEVTIDGRRVVIEGKEEVVLKCGGSSITLTRAGKILIRGKYLSSRSSGVNRIMGGSVQIN